MSNSENLIFGIGNIELGLSILSDWEFTTLGRFPDFFTNSKPKANYTVSLTPMPGRPSGSLIFDSGQLWRLYSNNDRRILFVGSRDFIPRLIGNFTADFHAGEIFISRSPIELWKYVFPLSYPLGEILMINLLGTGYGVLLHSCGVIDGEAGFVFAGIGGTGKIYHRSIMESKSSGSDGK